ncbi:MAG: hypothetical protein MJZ30_05955 [Paludibacteraceae bacterium]|nr:hypothetical protein [Paludibacteraceae bacterium]
MSEFNLNAIPTLQEGKAYAVEGLDWDAVEVKRATLTRYSRKHPGFAYKTNAYDVFGRPGLYTLVIRVTSAGESVQDASA